MISSKKSHQIHHKMQISLMSHEISVAKSLLTLIKRAMAQSLGLENVDD